MGDPRPTPGAGGPGDGRRSAAGPADAPPDTSRQPKVVSAAAGAGQYPKGDPPGQPGADSGPREAWTHSFELPIALEYLSPGGEWLAMCQKAEIQIVGKGRAGATSSPQLLATVDALLAVSPRGRFIVSLRGSTISLTDTETGETLDLSSFRPDMDADVIPEHRSFAFSSDERWLALLQRTSIETTIVQLRTGQQGASLPATLEHKVPVPIWRIRAEGAWFVLDEADLTPKGARFPLPRSAKPRRRCDRDAASYAAYYRLTEPDARAKLPAWLMPVGQSESVPTRAPGFVLALGNSWIERTSDGALYLRQLSDRARLTPPECGARIMSSSTSPTELLALCVRYQPGAPPTPSSRKQKVETRFPLVLASPRGLTTLSLMSPKVHFDIAEIKDHSLTCPGEDGLAARLLPAEDGELAYLIDRRSAGAIAVPGGIRVVSTSGDAALGLRGLEVLRFSAGAWAPLALSEGSKMEAIRVAGAFLAWHGVLFHPIHAPRNLGSGHIIALTDRGATVLSEDNPADGMPSGRVRIDPGPAPLGVDCR